MTIQEIYKKETGFDAYYFDSTPSKKYVKWLEKREKQLRIGGVSGSCECPEDVAENIVT